MSHQSLANKYRSKTFDELVGQEHIAHILKYQVAHHLRQANYLFCGPRGTGKTSSARLFAKALNCLETTDGNPCNHCANCVSINNNTCMDIMEIDAASHTGVDNIREEIIDKLMYRPHMLKKRVTIIDEVHMLSKGAFNALLKTMEEPTEWMVFILATTELHKVPDTIISRCQLFTFKKIPSDLIVNRLLHIAIQEQINTSPEALRMIADLSDGCMRDAVKYLDQVSVIGEVNKENVGQFLGVVADTTLAKFIDHYHNYTKNPDSDRFQRMIDYLGELSQQGIDLTLFPKQLMHYADRHFMDDYSLYSAISNLSAQLLSEMKWYPHPLLLYKTILYTASTAPSIPSPSAAQDSLSKATSSVSAPQNPAPTLNTEIPVTDSTSASAPKPEVKTTTSATISSQNPHQNALSEALALINKASLSMVLGSAQVLSIEDGILTLVVNAASLAMIDKKIKEPATYQLLCQTLTQTSGQTITAIKLQDNKSLFHLELAN